MSLTAPAPLPGVLRPDRDLVRCDIAIIGSGMGGATLAYALRESGARVVVIERGDFLPREYENWSPDAVFTQGRYRNGEQWYDSEHRPFRPGVHYYVGGNTKVYGATLPRFRESDFEAGQLHEGESSAWPITYRDLEPHYGSAERLYRVHGTRGQDPTDPWRSSDYPFPGVAHEPAIAHLADALRTQGLTPFDMPIGIDLRPGGACVRCATCDGFPCLVDAKSDADVCAIRPALASGNVELLTRTTVTRLRTDASGTRITEALGTRDGRPLRVVAHRFVLAAGAVNTAALLLRSGPAPGKGLADGSGRVGAHYMVHNSTFAVAVDPRRRNDTVFQKTLGLNDWYADSGGAYGPLGNVQTLGKLQAPMARVLGRAIPRPMLALVAKHSVDLYLTSEDLPTTANRVTLDTAQRVVVHWSPNNLAPHRELVRRATDAMRGAGYPLVFTRRMGVAVNSHQCGTAVMGEDPATSVVDPFGKAHDVANLWIADSAVFPSSAAVNPGLTIAANAFRVAAHGRLTA
ncbi:GMC family oxidoreductase [Streptomyces sp. SID3343]|uniref:GMC family oxidoreductase n=1 Tax=Streptomyces sp. SID3343 TaxID=2690260 RepID=UPI0031F99686